MGEEGKVIAWDGSYDHTVDCIHCKQDRILPTWPKLMPGFSSRTFSRCSLAKNMYAERPRLGALGSFFFLSPRVLLALEVALEAALGILMLSGSRVEKVVVVLRSLRSVVVVTLATKDWHRTPM